MLNLGLDFISQILSSLDILPDVEINDVSENHILSYSSSLSKWVNKGSDEWMYH